MNGVADEHAVCVRVACRSTLQHKTQSSVYQTESSAQFRASQHDKMLEESLQ